jgi:hypothetical protein
MGGGSQGIGNRRGGSQGIWKRDENILKWPGGNKYREGGIH